MWQGEGTLQDRARLVALRGCILCEEGIRDLRDYTLLGAGRDGVAISKRMMVMNGWGPGDVLRVTIEKVSEAGRTQHSPSARSSPPTGESASADSPPPERGPERPRKPAGGGSMRRLRRTASGGEAAKDDA